MKKISLNFFLILLLSLPVIAQNESEWVFDDTILPEVHITMDQDSLDELILNQESWYSDHEYPATFIYQKGALSDTVENIGFRIRGNTSRASAKKSFKVSFNTFVSGRQYHGLDKMNLNGEHNDPSVIRSKLSWDIFQEIGLPASRANHVKLYLNEEYFGLYINVEHIDDEFVQDRFGTDEGNLYKCLYGANLTTINGINCELTTNEEQNDYSDLEFLINFLNTSSDSQFEERIEDHLNVDGVLRWMAVDILTASWDDYWFLNNNYYLYKNPYSNRIEFIPYDYDNTFGIWWEGIYPGVDWGTRDPYVWGHPNESRPLTERILSVEKYKNRLSFYLSQFINLAFNEERMFSELDRLKALTEAAAEDDLYRTFDYGYTVEDYHNSFDNALGDHVTYGLKPYISARINSLNQQLILENIYPVFREVTYELTSVANGYQLNVQAEIVDEAVPVITVVVVGTGTEFTLTDPDGDGIFSGNVNLSSGIGDFSFYLSAEDNLGLISRFPNNSARYLEYDFLNTMGGILINEFLADNETGIQDETGSFEDWIELYNPTGQDVNLNGYFLTDDFNEPQKWALPDTTINAGEYLLIWADNDDEEGPLHTNFGLNNDGEQIGLYFKDVLEVLIVDTLSFGIQSDDISYGRYPDGGNEFEFLGEPTPGSQNITGTSNEEDFGLPQSIKLYQNYPNPFNPETTITFDLDQGNTVRLELFSLDGRLLRTLINSRLNAGTHQLKLDASQLSSGVYFYRLTSGSEAVTRKLMLVK